MGLTWKEEFSTGVEAIDEQHKILFRNLNAFENIIQTKGGPDVVEKMLKFLEQYAHKHFSFEEKLMEKYQCPAAEQNKEAHRRFFMVFEKLKQRYAEEGANEFLLEQIHSTVETWLVNHICGIDVQLQQSIASAD